jgi:argininosuccinate lyase
MKREQRQIWGNHLSQPPDELMVRFCAGRDVTPLPMADEELLPFDLWGNRAHAIMLHRRGMLEKRALKAILKALAELEREWHAGRYALDPALEDVHINIERYVTRKAGPQAGGRLHTARSRNDQVACDMRLYLRARLLELAEGVGALVPVLLEQAREHSDTLMPGFSHHQPAMLTTWGHWLCAYAQSLCRDLERLRAAYDLVNRSPLGAVAGFGTSWPIDRELTAGLLGFARVELNTLDAIAARGEHEAQVAHGCAALMNHLALIAQDLILLSHPYWGMVSLADAYTTGSSVMPQKRNPDLAEVIKGKAGWAAGMASALLGAPRGAMTGYNRDIQFTKYAVMDLLRECLPAPLVLKGAMETLTVNQEVMRERLGQGFLAAVDFADALARTLNLPFRAAYDITATAVRLSGDGGEITPKAARQALKQAKQEPAKAKEVLAALDDPLRIVTWRQHTGAPAKHPVRVAVEALYQEHSRRTSFIARQRRVLDAAHARCRDYAEKELG